ncbi:MAG: hypothetical protein MUC48_09480 [Leptolyngbya sp. Prado105]|jgi:hypothetical protein|nr:hypothetical protein [Leptolyngbya sp. Prado105]
MELVNYPQAIADASREFLNADQQVRQLEKNVEQLKLSIDSQVYFDPALKNQHQRDCRRAEMLRDDASYQAALSQLEAARQERGSARIHLKYLQDQFAALKLAVLTKLEFLSRVQTSDDIRIHLAGLGLEGLFASGLFPAFGAQNLLPSEAASQIVAFVEALVTELRKSESISDELWGQKMNAPEFLPPESEEPEVKGQREA